VGDLRERRAPLILAVQASEAALWLVMASLALRIVPHHRLFRELPSGAAGPAFRAGADQLVVRIRNDVEAVARRLPWHPACLPRALAGHLMCRMRGLQVPIAISVVKGQGTFSTGHARLLCGSEDQCAAETPPGRVHLGRIVLAWH